MDDVSAVRRAERFRACERRITHLLTAADTIDEAAPAVLHEVTEALGWQHAELWLADPLTRTLHQCGPEKAGAGRVAKGAGVVGTVWETGQPVWVRGHHTVLAVPVRDDGVLGVLACYTETAEDDQELLTVLLGGVAAQLGLTITLRRATDLTEQLDRTRDDFLALVGHEIRTPLASIASYADLLDEDPDLTADAARQMIRAIGRNAQVLSKIVTDLLELAGLEAGQVPLTIADLDLAELVAAMVRAAEPAASSNGVRLHTDLPASLHLPGDAARLRRVVDNLLSNAITYSLRGGDVAIRLTVEETVAELRVTDTGIGIPAGEQDRLFDRFYRASNVRHQGFLGAGLGLAMVRTIAALHHGSITLDTTHHPGTSLLLRLPLRH